MRGLFVAYDSFPIIVTNRKDEPSARLFTLCHELVHIVTKTSDLCKDVFDDATSKYEIEMKCNRIAGMVLLPEGEVRKHRSIELI